ncbi:MAG: Large extracellular alpha-helical protein, partial [Elusimicrobia bacterium]
GGDFPQSPALDQAYREVEDGAEVRAGKLSMTTEGETAVPLSGLPAGVYRLRLTAEEPWGGSAEAEAVVAVVDAAKGVPLKLGSVTVPEKASYAVGETARFLLGSAFVDALTYVEVWGGQFLLERRVVEGKGPRLLSLSLDERHKGGVTVRWFGVKDFRVRAGAATVAVPWKEKVLTARLDVPKVLRPGQKASARLAAKDSKGRAVSGEGTLRMYDRSLEYYAAGQADPGLASLYPARPWPNGAVGSQRQLSSVSLRVDKGWINELLAVFQRATREPLPPALRLNRGRVYGRFGRMRMMAMGASMDLAEGMPMAAPSPGGGGAMMAKSARADESDGFARQADKKEKASPPAPVKARSDFSETAFFAPQIPLREGKGVHAFKVPERLTSYRVTGYVVTPQAAYGLVAAETDVRKDLMVRVESPRYLREGDRSTFKALVNNLSPRALKVSVSFEILQDGKDAGARFALAAGTQQGTVPKDGSVAFAWPVTAPEGVGPFKLRATVRSGAEADAEERDLPVLPARQRLIESVLVALSGDGKKTLKAAKLAKEDPSRQDELLQLQVDPQLALTVLNALPFLIEYPYECVEQTLNRWLPAAVVSKVYAKHPAIAKAAAKVPKRSTITPPWERDDPKRLQSLMESPWLQVSQGLKTSWPLVDMLSPAAVSATEKAAFERLTASQLSDGSFPWFPGGRGDPYMTLYVLAGFAEARHYGVNVPAPMLRGALRYAMGEVPRRLKPDEGDVAFILYASYVLTAFPEELKGSVPELARAKELAKSWLTFAAKHDRAFTRLGHAYASYAWRRLGDVKKAEAYLDRAMDAARHDDLTGTYWTPEKNSWVWYNDDLETHAFLIRALQTLRPKDARLAGMVQWLLFNRKGTVWKSTKASAAAVFALLDFMEKTGALSKGDTFTVRWGGLSDAAQVGPADWLERPLRWTRSGQRSAADAEATVTKSGPGFAFASLTHIYSTTSLEDASAPGLLTLDRRFFKRVKKGESYSLEPLESGATVKVGDTVVTRLTLTSRGQLEYLHLKDPRGAGFEAETLRSGWSWDGLSRYEEPRDSLTNYFVNWMPQGEYKLESRVRPTTPGRYRVGAAILQSMYAPEFAAHSAGFELNVEE